jgi:hypothetical protein
VAAEAFTIIRGGVHRAARRTGALDVSVRFFVYSRDGCYELLAV